MLSVDSVGVNTNNTTLFDPGYIIVFPASLQHIPQSSPTLLAVPWLGHAWRLELLEHA